MKDRDTILIADDDPSLLTVLGMLLEEEGFRVFQAADGDECLHMAYQVHPDLILLDVMMPKKNGPEVCSRLRDISEVPIIMLTAISTEKQKVDSLTGGADDYVTKPFDNDELVARIRTILRRTHPRSGRGIPAYEDSRFYVDFEGRHARMNGNLLQLSPKEWRVLECLVKHEGRVVSRETLLRYAWGEIYEEDSNSLKVFISRLRRKLCEPIDHPRYIHTEREMGYRFEPRV